MWSDPLGRPGGNPRRPPITLLVWLVSLVLLITWYPFSLRAPTGIALAPPAHPAEVLGNLLLMAPLAAVIAGSVGGRRGTRDAILTAALVSVVVEAGQLFVVGRHPALADILLNVSGAVPAAFAGAAVFRRGVRRGAAVTAVGLLVAAIWAPAVAASAAVATLDDLRDWNPRHRLVAGDEVGGERTYRGHVREAQICVEDPAQDFCLVPGADLDDRRRLVRAALRTQRVSLSASVVPASELQEGPARILTFSSGPLERNVTLAQERQDLVLRIRTKLGGRNGDELEYYLPGVMKRGVTTHVRAAYDDGEITLEARTAEAYSHASFRPGLLESWMLIPLLANHLHRQLSAEDASVRYTNVALGARDKASMVAGMVLFLPVGLGLGRGLTASRVPAAFVSAGGAALLLYSIDSLTALAPEGRQLVLAALSAGAGALMAAVRRGDEVESLAATGNPRVGRPSTRPAARADHL